MRANRLGFLLLALVACSGGESVLRSDEPLENAWLRVALFTTGPESSFYKFERCRKLARDHGIWVTKEAEIQIALSLERNHNRITVGRGGSEARLDRILPEWRMQSLCSVALAMAAELVGRKVVVTRAEPPAGCVERGLIQGESAGVAPDAAVEDVKLRAARYGINYVVQDAAPKRGAAGLYLSGRAYACPATAASPASAASDEDF